MPLEAVLSRYLFSGAYERIARLAAMLCRLGVVLAVLQLASWGGAAWMHAESTASQREARIKERIAAIESVVAPSVAVLVRTGNGSATDTPGTFEWSMIAVRETSRSLLWGIAIVLLPLALTVGMLSPFVRQVDATRVLFGMIAVLGLLPLASAEAAPVLGETGVFAPMPTSVLAGIAAPTVAAVLLAAAAVLLAPAYSAAHRSSRYARAPRLSGSEVESIIRRGEHRGPDGLTSSQPRRKRQ